MYIWKRNLSILITRPSCKNRGFGGIRRICAAVSENTMLRTPQNATVELCSPQWEIRPVNTIVQNHWRFGENTILRQFSSDISERIVGRTQFSDSSLTFLTVLPQFWEKCMRTVGELPESCSLPAVLRQFSYSSGGTVGELWENCRRTVGEQGPPHAGWAGQYWSSDIQTCQGGAQTCHKPLKYPWYDQLASKSSHGTTWRYKNFTPSGGRPNMPQTLQMSMIWPTCQQIESWDDLAA